MAENMRVLITGGWRQGGDLLDSVEIYDPQSGSFSLADSLGSITSSHLATLLQDGNVLIMLRNGKAEIFIPDM